MKLSPLFFGLLFCLNAFADVPNLGISLSRQPLLQGEPFAVFISDQNSQAHPPLTVTAQLDGIQISLVHTESDLWAYPGRALNMQRSHMLVLSLFEQGTQVGSQTFSFDVNHNDSNAAYPNFSSITPNIGSTGTTVLVKGSNFASNAKVLIGGVQATTSFIDANNLLAVAPSFNGLTGLQPVEVQLPNGSILEDYPNVVANSAFYITPNQAVPNGNPVALIANASQVGIVGAPLQLDGSPSYDPQGSALDYEWKISAAPIASSHRVGEQLSNASMVSLSPDAPGVYVVSLVVRQANSTTPNSSHPQLAVLRVSASGLACGRDDHQRIYFSEGSKGAQ